MIPIFSCGTDRPVHGALPIYQADRDMVAGKRVVLVSTSATRRDAEAELADLGAVTVASVNAESPTFLDDLDHAISSETAVSSREGAPSAKLYQAGRACSAKFPLEILGDAAELVERLGRLSGAPNEYVIGTLFPVVGSIVSGYYEGFVRPGFSVPPVTWWVNVGCASSMKSVAQGLVVGPLSDVESEYFARYKDAVAAAKADSDMDPRDIPPPIRVTLNNATIEAAQHIAADQKRGVLNVADEFSTLAAFAVGRYNKAGYSGDYCSAYNGSRMVVDRRNLKEPLEIPCWGMSITSNSPPSVLSQIAQQTDLLTDNSGFDQRLWYLWPQPRDLEVRPKDDDHEALTVLKDLYRQLMKVRERPGRVALRFTDEARAEFEAWRIKLLTVARKSSDEVKPFVGKLPGAVVRLATTMAVLDAGLKGKEPTGISSDHFTRAVKFADVLMSHRRRVELERGQPAVERIAAELAAWVIEQGATTIDSFEIRRSVIPGLRTEATLRAVLLEMQAARWLRTYISPNRNDAIPPIIHIRNEVFDLDEL